jgi:hypothetical protein
MRTINIKALAGSLLAALLCLSQIASAAALEPALQAKVTAKIKEIQGWAADPAIVGAVQAYNAGKSPQAAAQP